MLYRVIYASEAVGALGFSTLTLAHILGAAERNNRRDEITGALMVHEGHVLQVLEGGRADLDRLMRRIHADPRHTGVRVLMDGVIASRQWREPMTLCDRAALILDGAGLSSLAGVTADEARSLLTPRAA